MTVRRLLRSVVGLFAVAMLQGPAAAQVTVDPGSVKVEVGSVESESLGLTGTATVGTDGASLSVGGEQFGVGLSFPDFEGLKNADVKAGLSYELELFSSGGSSGSAVVSAGLKIRGLPKALLDRLRGRCAAIRFKKPLVAANSSRSHQGMQVLPQRRETCDVRIELDGTLGLKFDLAAVCDDEHKLTPSPGQRFIGVSLPSPCGLERFAEIERDLLAADQSRDESFWSKYDRWRLLQDRIWLVNSACATIMYSAEDAMFVCAANRSKDLHDLTLLMRPLLLDPRTRYPLSRALDTINEVRADMEAYEELIGPSTSIVSVWIFPERVSFRAVGALPREPGIGAEDIDLRERGLSGLERAWTVVAKQKDVRGLGRRVVDGVFKKDGWDNIHMRSKLATANGGAAFYVTDRFAKEYGEEAAEVLERELNLIQSRLDD